MRPLPWLRPRESQAAAIAPQLGGHRLIIPDQRGHGASDAPACCYSASQLADDARRLLDALGIDRAAVVGHSMGSLVAQALAPIVHTDPNVQAVSL